MVVICVKKPLIIKQVSWKKWNPKQSAKSCRHKLYKQTGHRNSTANHKSELHNPWPSKDCHESTSSVCCDTITIGMSAECTIQFVRFLVVPLGKSVLHASKQVYGRTIMCIDCKTFARFQCYQWMWPPRVTIYNYSTCEPLNEHGAPYAQGIHTSCLVATKCTADIYINNGCNQPNCLFISEACNHVNAGLFLAKAVIKGINNSLTAKPCTFNEQVRKCTCQGKVLIREISIVMEN